nr:fructan 1-exohydrolase [Allium cepa]BDF83224.1 fructan 1-exohydrolase [Allium cepa]BDI08467.1 fructan 1-exohydrolase [Allium cepa]
MSSFRDLESPPLSSLSPLLSPEESAPRQAKKAYFVSVALMLLMLAGLAAFVFVSGTDVTGWDPMHRDPIVVDRGVKAGVSMKGSGIGTGMLKVGSYPWTNQMLLWQRSGFHFQPEKNWMNDPNGPMYYNGWYHFFYQYNPEAAVWGNIAWGHAVSKDLLNWVHLPLAMVPDRSYDADGVWTGSATILPDGRIIMLYTGLLNGTVQVQNIAVPANLSDPLLLDWIKVDEINPVMLPPPGVGADDFRDPSTAWFEPSDSTWRVTIGSKDASNSGIALVYSTKDFKTFTLLPNTLHAVAKVGMWECIDFYPIATSEAEANKGLDLSEGPSLKTKHVLKASTSDNGQDYYSIGTYDPKANTWVPDVESLDVGVGLRYDWGRFYASKTFYDEVKQRRILWGWVKEADSESTDVTKGWASLQGIPRTVLYDLNTKTHLLTWPVEEVESLRTEHRDFSGITVDAGKTMELNVGGAAQLDVEVEFTIEEKALELAIEEDVEYECNTSSGAAQRGLLGPFGLLVLANGDLTEQTATYFYVSKKSDGSFVTHFCQDELRSSKASDTITEIVGHTVPVLNGESFTLRVLIDHSIVESFAQGGRASMTSRVYPTEAIYNDARLFVFNNATGASITASSLNLWHMNSASNSNLVDL